MATSPLFDILSDISSRKTKWKDLSEEKQKFMENPYMVFRFLSMEPKFTELINYIQRYRIPGKNIYNCLINLIPKYNGFFNYIKSKNKKEYPEQMELLSSHFQLSQREIKQFIDLNLLTSEEITNITKQRNGI